MLSLRNHPGSKPTPGASGPNSWSLRWCTRLGLVLMLLMGLWGCGEKPLTWPWSDPLAAVPANTPPVAQSGQSPMLLLSADNWPMTAPVFRQVKRDFYDCKGLVGDWFETLLMAEMNFLAKESGLKNLPSAVCLVQIDRQLKPNEGRFVVHFYANATELSECAMKHRCQLARNVSLVLKNQAVYRSYFLSDFEREKYQQHCITPDGKWHPQTTCYDLT
jgi:predicted small lipoprotein YifL